MTQQAEFVRSRQTAFVAAPDVIDLADDHAAMVCLLLFALFTFVLHFVRLGIIPERIDVR
jgi:hypothetical protein